jgi:flavin-dependent dehydrogenase
MATKTPVAIVGAGPAGMAASIVLSKLGIHHTLFNKSTNPEGKPCAGGLTIKTLDMFRRLGIGFDGSEPADRSVREVALYDGLKTFYRRDVKYPFIVSPREGIDNRMFNHAKQGATIHQQMGNKVVSIDYNAHTLVAEDMITYEYDYLILADGANGYGAKLLDIKEKNLCVQTRIPITTEHHKTVSIYFNMVKGGYGYVFPMANYMTVGIGTRYDKVTDFRKLLTDFCARLGLAQENMKMEGAFIPAQIYIDYDDVPDDVFICGDAISHVSPLEGEGIPFALADGIKAAEIISYFGEDRKGARAAYKKHHNGVVKTLRHHERLTGFMNLDSDNLSYFLETCGKHPNFLQTCLEDGIFAGKFGLTDIAAAIKQYGLNKKEESGKVVK